MLPKDFENFDLRLKKLREESREDFERAEKIFEEHFKQTLESIFPRDVLGVKRYISGFFSVGYIDILHIWEKPQNEVLFQKAVSQSLHLLPLSDIKKQELQKNIISLDQKKSIQEQYIGKRDDIFRDPFFALVEDFSLDGNISQEEFIILEHHYSKEKDFLKAIDILPSHTKRLFQHHIEQLFSGGENEKQDAFRSEYHQELQLLEKRWYNIFPVIRFVSPWYYKSPGKLKSYEDPRRRLIRTFKMALLRLLRAKLGNIDAEIIIKRFEDGEGFDDYFLLLFQLLEVIDENPDGEEVYHILKLEEDTQKLVYTAEETKKKILEGEKLTANISKLIGETDAELEQWILGKILDDDTHFHGEEILFGHGDTEMAWVYAESQKKDEDDEDELEDIIDEGDTLRGNYERLKEYFTQVDEEKRKAFWEWNYDIIDTLNEKLMRIQSRIEKIGKLLGEEL